MRFYSQLPFTKGLRAFLLTFAAVCHIEPQPSLQTVGTRKTTRLHDADAESGASQRLWTLCPNAVFVADQLAENAAQKHQEKPCQPSRCPLSVCLLLWRCRTSGGRKMRMSSYVLNFFPSKLSKISETAKIFMGFLCLRHPSTSAVPISFPWCRKTDFQ